MSSSMDLLAAGIPASPSSNASSADSPQLPRTPQSPLSALPSMSVDAASVPAINSNDASAAAKRKPSRRANTAERRATHNAVERQRRETLNGRFLDLAALLPNLSQIRRPSKSAIVNSSIAHVHASRRHRMLAARELRIVRQEAEALRREINQWRERAGLPGVEEPPRSEAFALILSGDLELESELANLGPGFEGFPAGISSVPEEDDEFDDAEDYLPMQQPMNHGPAALHAQQQAAAAATMMQLGLGPVGVPSPTVEQQNPFAHAAAGLPQHARGPLSIRTAPSMMHHSAAMSPMSASFDNAAAALVGQYEPHRLLPHGHPAHFAQQATAHFVQSSLEEKWAQQQQQHLAGAYTPPASAHGPSPQHAALAAQLARQQALQQQRVFGSPVEDDGVGSAPGSAHGRGRSGSTASFNSSPRGAFDTAGVPTGAMPINMPQARLRERGMSINTAPGSWDGVGSPLGAVMGNMPMKASPGGHPAMAAMAGMF